MKARFDTVIIVDVQRAFPVPPPLVERIRRYALRFEHRVFTRFVNPPGSLFRRRLKQKCCRPGSEDTELLIAPQAGELVIDKAGYGLSPAAIAKLRRLGVKGVTVCGIDTDACVLGVIFSLFDAGIPTRVSARHCWSSTGLHRAGLRIIDMQFELLR
jgi:nicotinamidase-related amidase